MSTVRFYSRKALYNGIEFRSVLESRVARALDAITVPWEYEPIVVNTPHGSYLPDFRLDRRLFLEVKPHEQEDDRRWATAATALEGRRASDPDAWEAHFGLVVIAPDGWVRAFPDDASPAVTQRATDIGLGRCPTCGRWSALDRYASWTCGRCGAWSKDISRGIALSQFASPSIWTIAA